MDHANILGLIAGILTTSSFLPQVIKAWRAKSTKDISLTMYVVFLTGLFMWVIYGILLNSLPIIATNCATLVLAFAILILKIKYK